MAEAPDSPPRHNRRLRDYNKLANGKAWFATLVKSPAMVADLVDADLSDALYYASDAVTGAVGTNRIRKAIRAEAKKRGLAIP